MATTDDIARRVEEADSARSARRTTAAQLVGELARERRAVVQRLADIDQQIGEAITSNTDVIDVEELAAFTDVPATDLAQILEARRPARGRRRRSAPDPRMSKADREPAAVVGAAAPEAAGKP
ncbi:hypothetical protein [Lentzea cavernae]|uniref:Uncharacterized protein n=1 Tax=Lentzea cavernae TaxID=2020703 RepID=A0ABQ3MTX0_9PSEU|nr:hypothetical protein [Lentzea cavernae]GHH62460.1 hypothetical protein GCM10017774_90260 [Lentzea cavernae]